MIRLPKRNSSISIHCPLNLVHSIEQWDVCFKVYLSALSEKASKSVSSGTAAP